MTKKELVQYLKNHNLDDQLLKEFIDTSNYSQALKELPRIKHSLELKLYALEQLSTLIEHTKIHEENLKDCVIY